MGWCFNPLPPPKRGETQVPARIVVLLQFQSTPPAEARGDSFSPRQEAATLGFNPLPPPKRGETFQEREGRAIDLVSIHSPRRSEGRHEFTLPKRPRLKVSIHSPRRSEGRRLSSVWLPKHFQFQSTPPAEARGDFVTAAFDKGATRFNPLPPPKRGETPTATATAGS